MTADACKRSDLCLYLNGLAKKLYFRRTLHKITAQCAYRLIANKENRTFRTPQVMLQMMTDTACITHTGCRYDHLRRCRYIDCNRIITCNCCLQSRKTDRVNALSDQCHRIIVIISRHISVENIRCFHCQRTIYIYLKIIMILHKTFCLDLSDKIKHLLCSANSKGRNDHIAAPVESPLDDCCQFPDIIRTWTMASVTVSRFHNDIISFPDILRIFDNRLIRVADITGKYQFLRHTLFCYPYFDAG